MGGGAELHRRKSLAVALAHGEPQRVHGAGGQRPAQIASPPRQKRRQRRIAHEAMAGFVQPLLGRHFAPPNWLSSAWAAALPPCAASAAWPNIAPSRSAFAAISVGV